MKQSYSNTVGNDPAFFFYENHIRELKCMSRRHSRSYDETFLYVENKPRTMPFDLKSFTPINQLQSIPDT